MIGACVDEGFLSLFVYKSRGGRLVDGRGELFFGLCIPY